MNIDITSFFFNSSIEGATATPAWCTSIGQNNSKNCRIEDEKPGVLEVLTGMLYKSIPDIHNVDLSAGSQNREIILCSRFDKVYINNILIKDHSFFLVLARERSQSHNGRLLISYPPYLLYKNDNINQKTISAISSTLNCSNGCWFIYEISINNQDELHFSSIIVDNDKPKIYNGTSRQRSDEWASLIKKTKLIPLSKLGAILNYMYNNAEIGKQVAMIYIFVFKYGRYIVNTYKSNEIIHAANLKSSLSTEVDKAYNIYKYAFKKRFVLPGQQSSYYYHKYLQTIFYGSPGTGKSYNVNNNILNNINEDFIFRTTFHPDSDYASFIGTYKPITENGNITYRFEPQVFTNAYIKAWLYPSAKIFLIIEEINRGNCAQIFGDLFQLLDRKDGISEYPVKADAALTQYLKEVLTGDAAQGIEGDMLRLPSNLNIIATMNTSDQSLFPMDSAFKRRWDWKYIPTLPPKNEDKSFDLHFDSETISIDGKNIDAGDYEYSWTDFLKKINEKIFTATHSEDKQLGFWFVKTENPTNEIPISTFVSKVVFYLWNDVFKDLGPKGSNPFTIQKDGKSEVMHYNTFFEYNAKGEIVENMGVLHTFLRNVGLTPEPKKEMIKAQEADILQHDA